LMPKLTQKQIIMKKAAILISLIFFYLFSSAQLEWTIIHPYPTMSNLKDAHFISDLEGWVVGSRGVIMYTNDGCETWEIQHTETDLTFSSVFFTGNTEGWAVGWNKIYHTTNAGNTWEEQECPFIMGDLTDVYFINEDTGWIVGTYQIVLKTTDGGDTWAKVLKIVPGNKCFFSVCFTDELHGCATGGTVPGAPGGVIMVTNDGGFSWIETTPPENEFYRKVFFQDSLEGWICGDDGALIKTMDGGFTWEDKSFWYDDYVDIHFFDENNGILFHSHLVNLTFDGGETWDATSNLGDLSTVCGISSWDFNKLITVGFGNSISKTLDGGSTWENLDQSVHAEFQQIGFFDALEGLAIVGSTKFRQLIRTYDGGHTWQLDTLVPNGPFYKMWISGSSCYLLNYGQQIMKTNDGGENWKLVDAPGGLLEYFDMQFPNENTGYLCSLGGKFVKTIDGGETWMDKSVSDTCILTHMFFNNENKGWLINSAGPNILRTLDGGDSWYVTSLVDEIICSPLNIFFVDENLGYATTIQGKLFKTNNGGDTWESIYEFSSAYHSLVCFISENEGWVTISNVVYHTFDGGTTWDNGQWLGGYLKNFFFLNNELGWVCGDGGLVANYDITVGQNEIIHETDRISLFPNPSNREIMVTTQNIAENIEGIKVFNLKGQQVLNFTDLHQSNTFSFNISGLSKGVYIVHITTTNRQNLIKFIKQ